MSDQTPEIIFDDDERGAEHGLTARARASVEIGRGSGVRGESVRGTRMARLSAFEPACALSVEEEPAYRRRFGLLFVDESSARRGGLGQVVRVTNAQGETFALKTLIEREKVSGGSVEASSDSEHDNAREARDRDVAAFREEYECHRALSGLRGFPRLYGWGEVDGAPAIVMEWIEGCTLAAAARSLAVDEAGRVSPIVAARLGRDLFELVARMGIVASGVVHRDISPANVMVRTGRLPLDRQLAEGAFDLCLIDFGSSSACGGQASVEASERSFTQRSATVRRATPAYAPPEMLSDDLEDLGEKRRSSAIDVYAAASVVYELAAGAPPFAGVDGPSPYRIKVDHAPARLACCHEMVEDLPSVLSREPEVALAAAEVAEQLSLAPNSDEVREALAFADAQLADILAACLVPEQRDRPDAARVERALAAFAETYAENIGHSLRREPLEACSVADEHRLGRAALVRSAQGICGIAWVAAIASCAYAAQGSWAALGWGATFLWEGNLSSAVIALLLAAPAPVAFAARGRARSSARGLRRAGVALLACLVALLLLAGNVAFGQAEVRRGVFSCVAFCAAAVWAWLVIDYCAAQPALGPSRAPVRAGDPSRSLGGGHAAALEAGAGAETAAGAESSAGGDAGASAGSETDGGDARESAGKTPSKEA